MTRIRPSACAQRLSASLNSPHQKEMSLRVAIVRAQRLSASLNSPQHNRWLGWQRSFPCSTPFGITEFTTWQAGAVEGDAVLCSTPFGITEFTTMAAHL